MGGELMLGYRLDFLRWYAPLIMEGKSSFSLVLVVQLQVGFGVDGRRFAAFAIYSLR
jgi:hypothetical protein